MSYCISTSCNQKTTRLAETSMISANISSKKQRIGIQGTILNCKALSVSISFFQSFLFFALSLSLSVSCFFFFFFCFFCSLSLSLSLSLALLVETPMIWDEMDLVLPLWWLCATQPDLVPAVIGGDEWDHTAHGDPLAGPVVAWRDTNTNEHAATNIYVNSLSGYAISSAPYKIQNPSCTPRHTLNPLPKNTENEIRKQLTKTPDFCIFFVYVFWGVSGEDLGCILGCILGLRGVLYFVEGEEIANIGRKKAHQQKLLLWWGSGWPQDNRPVNRTKKVYVFSSEPSLFKKFMC